MEKAIEGKLTVPRLAVFFAGLILLALGIDLNTKTHLGISPINSVCYNIHLVSDLPLWAATYLYYIALILLQWLLLRRRFHPIQFFQLVTSFVNSIFIQFFDDRIPAAEGWPARILVLFIAIFITGVGASLTASMRFVPNAGEGAALAVAAALKKDFGFGKNVLDLCAVAAACVISLIFAGRVLSIGIGTLVAMLLGGRMYKLASRYTERIYPRVSK